MVGGARGPRLSFSGVESRMGRRALCRREEVVALSDRRSLKRYRLIFRAWITLRNGKRLYARDYGLKAFALTVKH